MVLRAMAQFRLVSNTAKVIEQDPLPWLGAVRAATYDVVIWMQDDATDQDHSAVRSALAEDPAVGEWTYFDHEATYSINKRQTVGAVELITDFLKNLTVADFFTALFHKSNFTGDKMHVDLSIRIQADVIPLLLYQHVL